MNPRCIVLESTVTGIAPLLCQQILIARMSAYFTDLLHCTNEPNVSIPQLANLLIERTMNGSWIVVFKSLVTVHHLMCYGSERFTQYLASSNCTFNLASFNDRLGTPQVKTESRGGLSVGHIYIYTQINTLDQTVSIAGTHSCLTCERRRTAKASRRPLNRSEETADRF